jgi:hypothetical protein
VFAPKRNDPVWLKVIRWLVRLFCIGFLALFLFFFIGEGGIEEFSTLAIKEQLRLFCIPGLFALGLILSFFKERFGGILMTLSVILYYVVSWYYDKKFPTHWDFWWLLIPAVSLIIFSIISQKQRKKRPYKRRKTH